MRRQRGQALVEAALIIPLILLLILGTMDIFPAAANVLVAKNLSARGARAAAIALPPEDCPTLVANAIGTPALLFADFTYTTPCVSGQYVPQLAPVTVSVTLEYHPSFWGGTWIIGPISTTDFGR